MTARLMQKLFGEVWWNYDHLRFNYKGIICLQSTLGWGVLAVLIFSVFNKMVERVVFSIYGYEGNYSVINCACYIICCGFLLPFY